MSGPAIGGLGGIGMLLIGSMPVGAAVSIQPVEGGVTVFMVPLSILVFAMLFEGTRLVWRGTLPEQAPTRRDARNYWQAGRDEG